MYHEYCLNYAKAMTYLEQLRKTDEFAEFEKVRTSQFSSDVQLSETNRVIFP